MDVKVESPNASPGRLPALTTATPATASPPAGPEQRTSDRLFWGFFLAYATVCLLWLWFSFFHGLGGMSASDGIGYFLSLLNLCVGLYLGFHLFRRRPTDRVARFLALGAVGTAAAYNLGAHEFLQAHQFPHVEMAHLAFHVVAAGSYICALLLFPDGRLFTQGNVSRWPLGVILAVAVIPAAEILRYVPTGIALGIFGVAIFGVGLASQWYSATHASTIRERQQARTFRSALLLALALSLAFAWLELWFTGSDWSSLSNPDHLEQFVFLALSPLLSGVPVALLVGLLRHHLWDVDKICHRALLYGILWTAITAGYVLIAVMADAVAKRGAAEQFHLGADSLLASALTTTIVVLTFERLKEWATHAANVLVFEGGASDR